MYMRRTRGKPGTHMENLGGAHFATQGGRIICFNVFDMFVVFCYPRSLGKEYMHSIHALNPGVESDDLFHALNPCNKSMHFTDGNKSWI